jgi:signal peptidase II
MQRVGIIAALVFALDQATKWMVVWHLDLVTRGQIDVAPPFLTLRMAWNRGVNFGLFAQEGDTGRWVLVALALVISAWVLWWIARTPQGKWAQAGAGLLVGGALGNVVDRVAYGAVADFLNMSCCGIENPYAFNVADISIFAGALALVAFASDAKKTTGGKPRDRGRKTP